MILRDPVHGLVSFDGHLEEVVMTLLETAEVQRLRLVRQVGLASLVFPGAEHSRFAHALGAAHVMVRFLERFRASASLLPRALQFDAEAEREAVAAALLHDLGHGPFSHLFEEVMPHARSHEEWTVMALRSGETEVHNALEKLSSGMSARVADLLTGQHRLPYLGRAISGTLDVDRCDYLLRDSHMTGVRYGLYDLDWLVRSLVPSELPSGEWVMAIEGRKGLPPIEGFFLGRNFMYQQVYHHKATRAAESLVRAIFARLAELIRDGSAPSPLPAGIRSAALGGDVSLAGYLRLDDARLHTCFADWAIAANDEILRDLCIRFHSRHLPKTIPLGEAEGADFSEAFARAQEIVSARGYRADLWVWLDVTENTAYAESEEQAADALWVVLRHQPVQRLGDVSPLLRELRNKVLRRPRLIVPADCREAVSRALEGVAALIEPHD